jgi:sulfur carrier protein
MSIKRHAFFYARRRHFFVTCIVINLKTRSMKLKVNDKEVETGATNLSQFSQEQNLPTSGIAIAVNQRMVPRTEWDSYALSEGDNILIIKAVCGG